MSVLRKNTEHFHVSKLVSADLMLMSRMYYWALFFYFSLLKETVKFIKRSRVITSFIVGSAAFN